MLEENPTQAESSPADEQAESSPVQSAEPTAKQGTEVPFHQHPRWQEIQREKDQARQEAAYWKGIAEGSQRAVQPAKSDSYTDMTPEEERFYRKLDARNKAIFDQMAQERESNYQSVIQALQSNLATVQEKLFRQEQKDVVPNSPEEQKIAQYISMGMPIEDATWAVMGPKRMEQAKSNKTQQTQQKVQQKIAANLETSGIPPQAGIKSPEKKLRFRENLEKKMAEAGY